MSRGRTASPFSPSSDREYRSRSEDVAAENSATLKGLFAPSEWPEFPLSSCKANGNYLGNGEHRFLTRESLPTGSIRSPVNGGRAPTRRFEGVSHLWSNIWYRCHREASRPRPIDSSSRYVLMVVWTPRNAAPTAAPP